MSNKEYFELLPAVLKNFFKKYPPTIQYSVKPTSTNSITANPFLFNRHPVTNKAHDPKYSLRRMSVLYKLAKLYGVESFLPPITNKKFFEEKYEAKKFMRGVIKPKGHKHELSAESRMKKMQDAIKNADKFIVESKSVRYRKKLEQKSKEKRVSWF
ncbi:probable 54S ribosomal protein L25, mitochondrial [Saccharomycodes ludwigii]|uniref:Probable 54S ribosomal protein L25, mitochondrial n=1 Tax=Saccharomycodes ludwigii TaxID=36035 RepID=A0A376B9B3_9ASCO|nr:hypothetical protein SCDLUD_005071 [Saccharomycodes ludwigii]KAH3898743.1 hypothetical protein SCDLUD_005071 [Saccharomycodes ludwigii]SSD61211.1 probable 54S ribosomal protein L25, mitochondrial [Saccharomycodes ludwigii]